MVDNAWPGSIVVMHINRRGWHTAQTLPVIIDALRLRGFEFVTVSELLASQATQNHQTREQHHGGTVFVSTFAKTTTRCVFLAKDSIPD